MSRSGKRLWWLSCALALVCAVPAQARFKPVECKDTFTPQQEIAYGQKAEAQIFQQMPILPDSSPVSQYVRQLGMRLAANAPGYAWPYNFHVVDSADINAFALPGGAVFVNLGTIQATDTEAQLAGVMAHEISHVVLRHSTCNLTKQKSKNFEYGLASLASAVLLGNSGLGGLAVSGIGSLQGLDYLHMSRDDEKQADLLGTDILYDTGYDPRALPQFFEIIESKYGKGGAQMLSDHPNPGNRVDYVNAEIDSLPRKAHYVETTPEFARIHAEAMGIRTYTAKEVASGAWKQERRSSSDAGGSGAGQRAPGQVGAGPGDAAGAGARPQPSAAALLSPSVYLPQGEWRALDVTEFSDSYPGNWSATGGQQSAGSAASVTIAPQGGIASSYGGGESAVAYGAVYGDAQVPQASAEEDAAAGFDAATQQVVSGLESSGGLRPLGSMTTVSVNGQDGRSQEFQGASPVAGDNGAPRREHDWLVTVWRPDGNLSYVVFVAPEHDFMALRPVFEKMLRDWKMK